MYGWTSLLLLLLFRLLTTSSDNVLGVVGEERMMSRASKADARLVISVVPFDICGKCIIVDRLTSLAAVQSSDWARWGRWLLTFAWMENGYHTCYAHTSKCISARRAFDTQGAFFASSTRRNRNEVTNTTEPARLASFSNSLENSNARTGSSRSYLRPAERVAGGTGLGDSGLLSNSNLFEPHVCSWESVIQSDDL